ncbi:G patch domain-containing protein 11 [Onthophagus taurus]|uniref:G patch domain-containing protein 11 n=1 Tax=Onthophagus taurus TaxID=166361 RepID=UPI0039BE068C
MSDNEDYMSDKFLEECTKSDVRPGLLFKQSQKRSLDQHKKSLNAKKPKSYKEQEKETREIGLNTALPSSNVGFKLLQKMGFKEGESLGKSSTGIKEPVPIIVTESSSGVGREKENKDVLAKKEELKEKNLEQKEQEFKQAISERNMMYILSRDYYKAQRACEELDSKNDILTPIKEHFWPLLTIKKLKEAENNKDNDENDNEDDNDEEEEEDEPPEEITNEKLNEIIDYLRNNYLYCLYCGFCGDDVEELNRICPGPYRIDHDDEL